MSPDRDRCPRVLVVVSAGVAVNRWNREPSANRSAPSASAPDQVHLTPPSRVIAAALIVGRVALLVALLLSAGCNAILGIDEPPAPPAETASDAAVGGPDGRLDVDSGWLGVPDGSTDATGVDVYAPPDRSDADLHEGGSSVADGKGARDGGQTEDGGDGGSGAGDGGAIGGDAGTRIVLRGTIGTIKLAPDALRNVRLVDHGIAVPWKSCNASNCVSGGIVP